MGSCDAPTPIVDPPLYGGRINLEPQQGFLSKEAADAKTPWHAFGHSVAAAIAIIVPSAIVLWKGESGIHAVLCGIAEHG